MHVSIRTLVLVVTASVGCLRFTEDPARVSDASADATVIDASVDTSAGTSADTSVDASVDTSADTGPTMCDRYGYAVVEGAMAALIPRLKEDCRVQRFFATMPAGAALHMQECMALQIGSIMRCSRGGVRVKYPGPDSKGALCRDMRSSHQGLGIQLADFDAMIDDVLAVLGEAKLASADLATIADVLRYQRSDIVTGDAGRGDACASDGAAKADAAPADSGVEL